MSYFSADSHAGAPMICLSLSPYTNFKRSVNETLTVTSFCPWIVMSLRCSSGFVGLIVATSKVGSAFAAIGGIFGGGGGMVHSVAGVARVRLSGKGLPWV